MSDKRETVESEACPKCGAKRMGEPFIAKDHVAIYWRCYSKEINGEFAQDAECRVRELTARLALAEAVAEKAAAYRDVMARLQGAARGSADYHGAWIAKGFVKEQLDAALAAYAAKENA